MGEYLRDNETSVGKSLVEIKKIDNTSEIVYETVMGQKVELHPLPVDGFCNCYLIIEKLVDQNIVLIDFVYGDINLNEFERNPSIRKKILEQLSRANISDCTRHYMGGLNRNVAVGLAGIIKRVAYAEMRTNTVNVNNSFQRKEKKASFGEAFFRFATRKANIWQQQEPEQEQESRTTNSTEIELYGNSPNADRRFTSGEGILFYPSGAAIIDGKVCIKFTYCTKDIETGYYAKLDTFLVSGINLERLESNDLYRKRFVSQMCVPSRLRNLRGRLYPYLGTFTSTMQYENDFEILDRVVNIREMDEGRY